MITIKNNPVTITESIKVGGFNLEKGMQISVTDVYERNGEAQVKGFINGNLEEVPAIWTDIQFAD